MQKFFFSVFIDIAKYGMCANVLASMCAAYEMEMRALINDLIR